MREHKRLVMVLAAGFLLVLISGGAWYSWYWLTTSSLRRTLPWSCSDVSDLYVDMFQDYSYYLRARMPANDFARYCTNNGLALHTEQSTYTDDTMWLSWTCGESIDWWKPSESLAGTYVSQSGHEWVLAKYEEGYIYVKAWSH
jgi:hypothetical protein